MSNQQMTYLVAGVVGCGFYERSLERGLEAAPTFIGIDAGSTDPGPRYLATGEPVFSRAACKRDLDLLVAAARSVDIPLIVGSAGGSGGDAGVDFFAEIVREVATERSISLRLARIYSEIEPATVIEHLDAGTFAPLHPAPSYDAAAAQRSRRIVAVMGVEPIQEALRNGAQVVIAGRATDTAIFAAVPLAAGMDPSLSWHAAKIAECGTSAAEPRGRMDVLQIDLLPDRFLVRPLRDGIRCTPMSVSSVQLHEVTDPTVMVEPGWRIDLREVRYEVVDDITVSGRGASAIPTPYTNKIEGVELAGYQSMFLAAVRDPTIVEQFDAWQDALRPDIQQRCAEVLGPSAWAKCQLTVRAYGRNGVLGDREPLRAASGHELGLAVDVISPDPDLTRAAIEIVEYAFQHGKSPRWRGHGTLAYAFTQRIFHLGEIYAFNAHHVLQVESGLSLFRTVLEEVR